MGWPWWPFGRTAEGGYTVQITAAAEMAATLGPAPNPAATAAAEIAGGLLGRALASAEVTGPRAGAVTPAWRRRLGYDLVTTGEHLSLLEVEGSALRLTPASTWTFHEATAGGWRVQAQIPRPSAGTETKTVAFDGVVSLLWAEDRLQPWRGVGPLQRSALSAGLYAAADRALGSEMAGTVGHVVPIPKSTDPEIADLREAIAKLGGRTALVESTAGGHADRGERPRHDWKPERIGHHPPDASVTLQAQAFAQTLAACGVPLELAAEAGAQRREAYRQYVATTVEPIAEIVAAELSAKLEAPVGLTFGALAASDMAGRSRAAGSLVKAGWTPQEAADAVGLPRPAAAEAPAQPAPAEPMADGAA